MGALGVREKYFWVGTDPAEAGAQIEVGAAVELAFNADGLLVEIPAFGKALHQTGAMLWVIGVAQDEGGDLSIGQGLHWLRVFLQDLLRGGGECLPMWVHRICWKRDKIYIVAIIIKRLLPLEQLDYWISGVLYVVSRSFIWTATFCALRYGRRRAGDKNRARWPNRRRRSGSGGCRPVAGRRLVWTSAGR